MSTIKLVAGGSNLQELLLLPRLKEFFGEQRESIENVSRSDLIYYLNALFVSYEILIDEYNKLLEDGKNE